MEFLQNIKLIQGGMGVYVSNWRLAKSVAMEKPGVTAGTVSGTALDVVHIRLLQLGDPGGHLRRALAAFDEKFGVEIGRTILEKYFIEGGKAPAERFRYGPKQTVHTQDGNTTFPMQSGLSAPIYLALDEELIELLIATSFAEVWLAKEGHAGNIFINFLNKVEIPLIFAMYGAMLAGVDGIVVGAGNPDGLPAVCTQLAQHATVAHELSVLYRESGESFILPFDPRLIAAGKLARTPLKRPAFLAIVSLENLVNALVQSPSQAPDGFIIEHHTAGGHNAAPQGPMKKDELGQPIYSELDEPDLIAIRQTEKPFWLAGGYGSQARLQLALNAGAVGVQTGSIFAMAEESGISPTHRIAIFNELKKGTPDSALVQTSLYSPTGFPFKVAQLNNTLADDEVYEARRRLCDLGFLQQRGLTKADENGSRRMFQRCSAAPIQDFVSKRGLPFNTDGKRCLCNGLLSGVGLGQMGTQSGDHAEEPAIVTLGNNLDGIRRLSRQGQAQYWAKNVVEDILG
ncbi:MAG: 2-nitropropane dioxygenase [Chloroflexi bacterium HGW-Chloroflexi-10]|nr:MAG: 2-nitropropane dioxygenase [Chloroflexi bacterium HGW-Chloroflexi-10]